jgi:Prp8 binding protein
VNLFMYESQFNVFLTLRIFNIISVLWDVYGECRNYNVLSGHKNAVLEVHWTPEFLLSCSADKTVALWDANKGVRVRKYGAHTGIVNSCAPARDDWSMLVSGSDDCSARVWDRRQRQEVFSLQHDFQVTSVCMSHDGQFCFTGGIDNIIRLVLVGCMCAMYLYRICTDSRNACVYNFL